MYIRLVEFNLGKGRKAEAESLADKFLPLVRARAGAERSDFYEDEETGTYGFTALFSTKKDADDAYEALFPVFSTLLREAAPTGAPSIRTLPVYEPK